ncbi:MAG TPA: hypothetical protein VF534_18320 [Paraburkholderia sp.]
MNPSPLNVRHSAHDAEIDAHLCAYNSAFDELGLRFRWDVHTLVSLALIDGEQERIAAYIETHHAHLLSAYSAAFLSQAILEKKNARYPGCVSIRVESSPRSNQAVPQSRITSSSEPVSYEMALPALAGI